MSNIFSSCNVTTSTAHASIIYHFLIKISLLGSCYALPEIIWLFRCQQLMSLCKVHMLDSVLLCNKVQVPVKGIVSLQSGFMCSIWNFMPTIWHLFVSIFSIITMDYVTSKFGVGHTRAFVLWDCKDVVWYKLLDATSLKVVLNNLEG